jgi:hypothetical protein
MSNRQLDEQQERDQAQAVAIALGISLDDLDQLDWSIDEITSEDGVVYGYDVYLGEDAPEHILVKLGPKRIGHLAKIGPF